MLKQHSRAVPTSVGEKVFRDGSVERNPVPGILIQPARGRRIIRPIDKQRLANDVAHRDETPITAVTGVVAIITHYKELAFRHNGWPPAFQRIMHRRMMHRVWLLYRLGVHVEHAILNFQPIAAKSRNTLEESFRNVFRVAENDNIAAMDGLEHGQAPMDQRNLRSIKELVHK